PKLEGTIHTAAEAIEAAGGKALPILGDVRDDDSVADAVARTVEAFGGIDIVVNNASAIDLSPTSEMAMKKYDLMQDINCRGSYLLSKTALPHLEKSEAAHVLTLSPPLNLNPKWAGQHLGYTIAKYGMSLVTLGLAEELRDRRLAANRLTPRTRSSPATLPRARATSSSTARSGPRRVSPIRPSTARPWRSSSWIAPSTPELSPTPAISHPSDRVVAYRANRASTTFQPRPRDAARDVRRHPPGAVDRRPHRPVVRGLLVDMAGVRRRVRGAGGYPRTLVDGVLRPL